PGIVRLTAEDLRLAGCPVELITAHDTHLHNRGRELPFHFVGGADGRFDDYDYIDFYAIPNERTYSSITPSLYQDFWTTENVYWLSWGDGRLGLRLSEEDGSWKTGSLWGPSRVKSQNYVRITSHFERDLKMDRLQESTSRWNATLQTYGPQSVYEDHWFWGDYIDVLSSRQFSASIFYPYTRSQQFQRFVGVRAALQGLSFDHHRAIVSLNGITAPGLIVGKVTANDNNIPWISQTPIIVQTVPGSPVGIENSDLLPSGNVLSVSVPGDGLGGTLDKIYANWFEVDYDRDLRALNNYFMFSFDTTRGDTFSYDIRGFANGNIEVWKLGQSRLTNLSIRSVHPADEGSSYAVRFQLISYDGYTVLAFDDRHPRPPLAIVPEYGTRDLRNLTGSEYLIIYHDSFADDESLRRLDSLRRVTFHGSVDTFRVSEIYDQFSHGIANPEAIQRFLKYAYEHWTVRPTHACLIGDGIVDTRDPYHQQGNLIPSLYIPTWQYGMTASDGLFGCVSGPPSDILPDVAIGRISCRSPEELAAYVEKLVRYQDPNSTDYSSLFHSRFLFVSDGRDSRFNFDRSYSEPSISLLPDHCNVSRVYLDSITSGQGPSILRNAFRDGAILVNYNGHGAGGQWSGTNLMDVSGVSLLNNAHAYPFITNFTCFVGAFDDRNQSGVLGEAFLFSRNSRLDPVGAIGVYSTTCLGWAAAGAAMQARLFNFVGELPGMTTGEIITLNKILYWRTGAPPTIQNSTFSMMMSMALLGDPGVRLALPQTLWTDVRLDTNVARSTDTLYVSGRLPWDPQGRVTNVYLLPYNGAFNTTEVVYGVSYTTTRSKTPAFNTSLVIPIPVRTQQFDSLAVLVGPVASRRFIAPAGNVVLYATDPGGPGIPPRDAIAALPIFHADSMADLRVYNLTTLPYSFIPNDTLFRFEVGMTHRDRIETVRARGVFRPAQGPVVLDTVRLTRTPVGRWQTPDLGPHPVYGGTYRLQFFVQLAGGSEVTTAEFSPTVEQRADYGIYQGGEIYPRYRPAAVPEFSVPIQRVATDSTQANPELRIRLTAVHDSTYYDSTLGRIVTVPADSFATFASVMNPWQQPPLFETRILTLFRPGSYRVTVLLDPDNVITETNEANNHYQTVLSAPHIFPASNTLGTYLPRLSPQTNIPHVFWRPGVADTIQVRVWPGSLPTSPTCLIYRADSVSIAQLARLASVGLFPVVSGQSTRAFRVTLSDTTERLAEGGSARVTKTFTGLLDSSMVSNVALFLKRDGYDEWWMLRNQTIETVRRDTTYPPSGGFQVRWGGRVSGDALCLGTFAVFRYSDNRGPDISLAAEGLRFTRHSILPRKPEIYANLSDLSGIDRSPGRFYFVLDGDTLPDSDIAWSDSSAWGGNISAIVRPELDPGTHTIRVKATDNIGNTDSLTADFEVRGEFGIEWAINYPNPFQAGTTIAYVVTDVTDDFVEVKIFTVSGRHIQTIRERARAVANYREIFWNGRDMHQDEVANGVYFARITAKQGKQEVEKIIKLAKVR
ncbi:T9SS type A sorting domain-containing protein, partial [bacterium]|nr:T9SS type A sorting domain-containing protein [bacterium]